MPTISRFWSKVDFGSVGDCWNWTASKNKQGYGQFRLNGKGKKAHRVAYKLVNGPLPSSKVKLDHRCRNTSCVNPLHLDPVTQKENVVRGALGGFGRCRTHCPQNHEYTERILT